MVQVGALSIERIAAAILGLLLVAACGETPGNQVLLDTGARPADSLTTWRHGIVEAKGDSGVLFMPARGGFAAKHGIDLQIVQFVAGTTPVRAILAGELDSFEASPVVALAAMNQGADIKVIGCHWPVMTYSLFGRRDIGSIEDLRGQTIGVSTPGSLPDLFAREALASVGLGEADVRFANAGGSADRFRAVAAGVVAAAASSSEFEVDAEARGMKVLLRGAEATPDFLKVCIMTTGRKIAERRADMERFLAGAMEGYAYALNNREAAIGLARQVAQLSEEDLSAEFVFDEAVRYSAVTPDLAIPIDKLQWDQDMMVRHGVLDRSVDVSQFVDDSVRQAALRLADL